MAATFFLRATVALLAGASLACILPPGAPVPATAAQPAAAASKTSAEDATSRLRVQGRRMVRADGTPFVWRFASGFSLVSQVAHGRQDEARAFLRWAADAGFNGVRAFAMLPWADLSPDEGRAALGDALALAREFGLYVEVVAIADARTFELTPEAMRAQVREVGRVAAAHPNALVELANENAHRLSLPILTEPAFLRDLRALIPDHVPVAYGAGPLERIEDYAGGDYITVHLPRLQDPWAMLRGLRDLHALSERTGKFVVSDEPIGAGERDEDTSRSADPSLFYALGVLSRVFSLGSTFHFDNGLRNERPGPIQRESARMFIEGTRVVADGRELIYRETGDPASPVESFSGAAGVYTGVADRQAIVVAVGVQPSLSLELRDGWRIVRTIATHGQVEALELTR